MSTGTGAPSVLPPANALVMPTRELAGVSPCQTVPADSARRSSAPASGAGIGR